MVSLGRPRVTVTQKSSAPKTNLKINISRLRTFQTSDAPQSARTAASAAAQSTPRSPRTPRSSTPGSARQRTPRGAKAQRDNGHHPISSCPEEIQKDEDEDDTHIVEQSWERTSSLLRNEISKVLEISRNRTIAASQTFTQLCNLIGSLQVEHSEDRQISASPSRQRSSVSPPTEIVMDEDL